MQKLTEKQQKVAKLIRPMVKSLVMEAAAPITKKFMPTDGQLPTDFCDMILIAKNGNYFIGSWNGKAQKLEKVGDWLRHYGELPITNFTHYAV